MNKNLKKLLALAMTGCMAFTMSATAFAISSESALEYAPELQIPTIEVELTANSAIVMNPYGLTYINPVTEEEDTASLVTAVNAITNRTLAPLDVDVTVTSSAPETVAWGSSTVASSTSKEIFLQFALEATDSDATDTAISVASWSATSATDMISKSKLATAKAALVTLDGSEQIQGEDSNYFVMAAATPGATADAEVEPTYAHFQLVGDLAQKSEDPWTEEDIINVSVAFTFNMMSAAQLTA